MGSGAGLGLAICHEYVRLMGGGICVHSQLGKGSTFEFDILLQRADESGITGNIAKKRIVGILGRQRKIKVLIVDDEMVNCELVAAILAPIGFLTRRAGDGHEGGGAVQGVAT